MLTNAEHMSRGNAGFDEALARLTKLVKEPPPIAERVLGGAAAGLFLAGVISASFLGRGDDGAAVEPAKTTSPPAAVSLVPESPAQTYTPASSVRTGRYTAPTARKTAGGKQSGAKSSATTVPAKPADKPTPTTTIVPAPLAPLAPVVDPIAELLAPVTDALSGGGGGESNNDGGSPAGPLAPVTDLVESVTSQLGAAPAL